MAEKKPNHPAKPEPPDSKAVREYIQANLLVWGFLVLLAIASFFVCGGVWDDITEGTIEFLFLIIGCGFTLVSFLDYLYDRNVKSGNTTEEKHP